MINFSDFFEKSCEGYHKDVNDREFGALFEKVSIERDEKRSGYYTLPFEMKAIEDANDFNKSGAMDGISHLVVIGIGGSSLGLKAIDSLLCHSPNRNRIKLRFLEHADSIELERALSGVELEKSMFLAISKSGGTIETISLLKYVIDRYSLLENPNSKSHLAVVTDEDSPLHSFAKQHELRCYTIDRSVGGRFSILSTIGILPLSILGYNVESILSGAREFSLSFFDRREEHLLKKALLYSKNRDSYPMNVLFSYGSSFCDFNDWYVQLWGESLGKIDNKNKKVGLTPISLIGSIDQHSFLQLIVQGRMDKSITFLRVANIEDDRERGFRIPDLKLEHLEDTDFINTQTFSNLLFSQQVATMESVIDERIPTDLIELDSLSGENVGALISYYELLTSSVGCSMGIDSYNQPGVEFGKIRLRNRFKN